MDGIQVKTASGETQLTILDRPGIKLVITDAGVPKSGAGSRFAAEFSFDDAFDTSGTVVSYGYGHCRILDDAVELAIDDMIKYLQGIQNNAVELIDELERFIFDPNTAGIPEEVDYIEYNFWQSTPGTKLLTKSGNLLRRDPRYGVGYTCGDTIFAHREYAYDIIGRDTVVGWNSKFDKEYPDKNWRIFSYNTSTGDVVLYDCDDFDSEVNPHITWAFQLHEDETTESADMNITLHHKWLLLTNDYTWTKVAESWNHSKWELYKLDTPVFEYTGNNL